MDQSKHDGPRWPENIARGLSGRVFQKKTLTLIFILQIILSFILNDLL